MGILWGFAPFIAFALVERLIGPAEGLFAGALISGAILMRDLWTRGRTVKVLDVGSTILFGGLAAYAPMSHAKWSVVGVRLCVDLGLMLIVLVSLAIRKPFTLQYARERASTEQWSSPHFLRTNYVITGVWAAAFAILVAADITMLYFPEVPHQIGIWMTVAALVGAIKFSAAYPAHVRRTALKRAAA